MHVLIIASGKHKGRRIELPDRQVLIGRDENCLVRMTSSEVSRQHCSLTPTDGGLLVRDCNSQNGTFVNHQRIQQETTLRSGDMLQIGPVSFHVAGPPTRIPDSVEENVLSWLSDSDSSLPPTSGDTTVIKLPPQLQPPEPEPRPARFKSVADEAQDILREWRESHPQGAPPR
jgi:pSer/pThr/pTyr-binding forkhead associated (FHA) protein